MTLQTFSFGKYYVVYGGIFIVMALIWTWKIDNFKPDKYDLIGTAIIAIRITVILFIPRQ